MLEQNTGHGIEWTNKYCYIVIYTFMHHDDTTSKTDAWRKTPEGRHMKENAGSFFTTYLPLTLLQGFERLACERMLETEHKLHILTPLLWLSRCVLFSWCWGPLHRGFPRAPSVGCGFPYHISSLTLWESAGNCIGVSEVPLGRVWPSLPHLVWPSLPHLVSTVWNSTDNCIGGFPSAPSVECGLPYHIWSLLSGIILATAWDPNSTELNNNSTPTRSPTGSLKSNV